MPLSSFRDVLWDLTYEGAGRLGAVCLRVFANEREMFGGGKRSTPGMPVSLPMSWFGNEKAARSDLRSQPDPSRLEKQGRKIWEAIPPEAKAPLLDESSDQPCRLKISTSSPAIDDLPWEWLNDGGPPFALRPELRLARSVPVPVAIPPLTVEPPLRVLLIVTYPVDEARPDVFREIDAISTRLQAAPYQLDIVKEPTRENLVEALRRETQIVHYVGHAGLDRGDGNLILHDSRNVSRWIGAAELSSALPPTVRLLCLSTCFTVPNYQILGLPRLAQAAASYRLPTTIANRYAVSEASVRRFWEVFYDQLPSARFNVSDAFHAAQQAVAVEAGTGADWGSFSLVIRDQLGEPFRLDASGGRSVDRYSREMQATMISQVANELAQGLESFGPDAPVTLREMFEEQAGKADDLAAALE